MTELPLKPLRALLCNLIDLVQAIECLVSSIEHSEALRRLNEEGETEHSPPLKLISKGH